VRWPACGRFTLLIAFALTANALNVVNSYVGRAFMKAISQRNQAGFVRQAALYVGVFDGLHGGGGALSVQRGAARPVLADVADPADRPPGRGATRGVAS
jgi:hypothetical protein